MKRINRAPHCGSLLLALLLFLAAGQTTIGWAAPAPATPALDRATAVEAAPPAPEGISPQLTETEHEWGWHQPLPQGNSLAGIDCTTSSHCVAVGDAGTILLWDGASWNKQPSNTTANFLEVDCLSAIFCAAVGTSGTLHVWNGANWQGYSSGTIQSITDVSCLSVSECVAVGAAGAAWAWNGSAWVVENTGTSATLHGVSCVAGPFCLVVGESGVYRTRTGPTWGGGAITNFSDTAYDVICLSSTSCFASADFGTVLAWDGSWNPGLYEYPLSQSVLGIACVSPSACAAVGGGGEAAIKNGGSWNFQPTPLTSVDLADVSCITANDCFAVGEFGNILRWNGSGWSNMTQGAVDDIYLYGISCVSATACVAVGEFGNILHWNGATWSIQNVGMFERLNAVSCVSLSFCKAVGDSGRIFNWDGTAWIADDSSAASETNLLGVSCASNSLCKAVGESDLILNWTPGTGWTVDDANTPAASPTFRGVSCPTESYCVAVGDSGTVRSWTSGTVWSSAQSSGTTNPLNAVSCSSDSHCVAVGDGGVIRSWTAVGGNVWNSDTSPTSTPLYGVGCVAADDCVAVGSGGVAVGLNGTSWTAEESETLNQLYAASCVGDPGFCMVAGSAGSVLGRVPLTLTDVQADFELDIFNVGCLTGVTVTQTETSAPNAPPGLQTGKHWQIEPQPSTCTAGIKANLTLPHTVPVPANARVCRYTGPNFTWDCAASAYDADSVTRIGITGFSIWAVGDASQSLAVTMAGMEAAAAGDHVLVTWETAMELENLGFNLYRAASADATPTRINATMIPSESPGSGGGFLYQFRDGDVTLGKSYFYWIESIAMDGTTQRHGPVSATLSAPTAVTLGALGTQANTTFPLLVTLSLGLAGLLVWRRWR